MTIRFAYGLAQQFRFRTRDLTFPGTVEGVAFPLRRATWSLNGGPETAFHVEAIADPGIDWTTQYKDSPAELRCRDLGDFTIEVPVTDAALAEGENRLAVAIEDAAGRNECATLAFAWDPRPVPLPLDLADLAQVRSVQEIGQVVAGAFDVDPVQNVVRSRAPVYPDSMLVLGSPNRSQEATYNVRFLDFTGVKWLGPSDFFVGFEDKYPPIGIKTGWSSAGMIALNPRGEARSFISWGDHSETDREWVVVTDPPARFPVEKRVLYAVRHQVLFEGGVNRVRFRIWRADEPEPEGWLCEEDDSSIAAHFQRHDRASFGLFQHSGMPIEWSNLRVRALSSA